jgi:hypothetical protein
VSYKREYAIRAQVCAAHETGPSAEAEGSMNMGYAQRIVDERPQDQAEDLTVYGRGDFFAERGIEV